MYLGSSIPEVHEGIGLSVSVGLALANRLDGNANHIFTLIGDGESNEGQVWGKRQCRRPNLDWTI